MPNNIRAVRGERAIITPNLWPCLPPSQLQEGRPIMTQNCSQAHPGTEGGHQRRQRNTGRKPLKASRNKTDKTNLPASYAGAFVAPGCRCQALFFDIHSCCLCQVCTWRKGAGAGNLRRTKSNSWLILPPLAKRIRGVPREAESFDKPVLQITLV